MNHLEQARSAVLLCWLIVGCSSATAPQDAGIDSGAAADQGSVLDQGATDAAVSRDSGLGPLALPPANGTLDYQLGGAYPPPTGVTVMSRDRLAPPAAGVYNICYVNGFQTQPDERDFWTANHNDLLLRDGDGDIVIDPDWGEIILDITTPSKRTALAGIVGDWIDDCGSDGFDAVEIDNLDTYFRSDGLVSQDDAVAFMRLLSERAHAAGLPIAQKNSAEVLARRAEMGTDFAVVEECNRYDECGDFTAVYGTQVYVIEYRQVDFDEGCAAFPELSIVLRDLQLVEPGDGGYVYDAC